MLGKQHTRMRLKTRLKKGDRVVVITGREKGKKGEILKILDGGRLLVEKTNMIKRHTKQNRESEGGIIEKEGPIHISNVMLVDPSSERERGTRIGMKFLEDGRKVRSSRASGEVVDR